MGEPTFMLCIGATKAGTTWLYHYLDGHPQARVKPVKELHYFDTRADTDMRGFYLDMADRKIAKAEQKLDRAGLLKRGARRRTLADLRAWRDLLCDEGPGDAAYRAFLLAGAGSARVVADITPCYATLGREDFARMAAVAEDVRFVFLLRDPVDRAWSQARMNGSRIARNKQRPRDAAAASNFDRFLDGRFPMFEARSDYRRTLTELLSVVPRERVHLAFYEELFTEAALAELTDFLGIARQAGDLDRVMHGGAAIELAPERRARARAVLQEQYEFCESFFDGRLPARWRHEMEEA